MATEICYGVGSKRGERTLALDPPGEVGEVDHTEVARGDDDEFLTGAVWLDL